MTQALGCEERTWGRSEWTWGRWRWGDALGSRALRLQKTVWQNMGRHEPHPETSINQGPGDLSCGITSVLSLDRAPGSPVAPSAHCQTRSGLVSSRGISEALAVRFRRIPRNRRRVFVLTGRSGQDPNLLENHSNEASGKNTAHCQWVAWEFFWPQPLPQSLASGQHFLWLEKSLDAGPFHRNHQRESKAGGSPCRVMVEKSVKGYACLQNPGSLVECSHFSFSLGLHLISRFSRFISFFVPSACKFTLVAICIRMEGRGLSGTSRECVMNRPHPSPWPLASAQMAL